MQHFPKVKARTLANPFLFEFLLTVLKRFFLELLSEEEQDRYRSYCGQDAYEGVDCSSWYWACVIFECAGGRRRC